MRYFWLTVRHKWFVFRAGLEWSVPLWRLITHDLSKFTRHELPHYDRQFFGPADRPLAFGPKERGDYADIALDDRLYGLPDFCNSVPAAMGLLDTWEGSVDLFRYSIGAWDCRLPHPDGATAGRADAAKLPRAIVLAYLEATVPTEEDRP